MKQIFTLLALAFFAVMGSNQADAAVLNNHPDRCPSNVIITKAVSDVANNCWETQIQNVEPGDQIVVGIIFHNTSPETLNNLRFKLTDPRGGSGTSMTFNGSVTTENGEVSNGQATAYFSKKVKLTYLETYEYHKYNGDNARGESVDTSGKILSGQQYNLNDKTFGMCPDNCPQFQSMGVMKVYFRVDDASDVVTPPNPTNEKAQWNTNGYPQVQCLGNGKGNVTVAGISNGRTYEFTSPFGGYTRANNGNDKVTWYNVPSKYYDTNIRYEGDESSRTWGAYTVNCGTDTPPPTNTEKAQWRTPTGVTVTCNGNNTGDVTLYGSDSGRAYEFYNRDGSWTKGVGSVKWYSVPTKSGVYDTHIRFEGNDASRTYGAYQVNCGTTYVPPTTTPSSEKAQWNTSGYPLVVCNQNGTATVTVAGINNGKTYEFTSPFGGYTRANNGNDKVTWYNVPSKYYDTNIRYEGDESSRAWGAYTVNCSPKITPIDPPYSGYTKPQWDVSGLVIACNSDGTANVTVKGISTGKTLEFYNQITRRYETSTGNNSITWYGVPNLPDNNGDGMPDVYSSWIHEVGAPDTEAYKTQGFYRVSCTPTIVNNTSLPSVETLDVQNIGRTYGTIFGRLTSTGNLATNVYFKFGRRQGSYCANSDLTGTTPGDSNYPIATFNKVISSLSTDTWYCYRAYASNTKGTVEGDIKSFKTNYDEIINNTAIKIITVSAVDYTNNNGNARLRGEVQETGKSSYVQTWFEYSTSENEVSNGNARKENVGGDYVRGNSIYKDISGLSRGTRYYFRACGSNTSDERSCGNVLNFITIGDSTEIRVDTESETDVSYNSARMNGRVRETGKTSKLQTWFEYSTSESNVSYGSGTKIYLNDYYGYSKDQRFAQLVNGLSSNTRYYYRACGNNTENEKDCGDIESFTTLSNGYNPPTTVRQTAQVTTLSPSRVYEYDARLNGSYTSRECATELWFEYGTSSSNLNKVVTIGSKSANSRGVVAADVSGLTPGRTYYYRIVGSNCNGIARGSIKSFRTQLNEIVTTVKKPKPIAKKPVITIVEVKEDVSVASTSMCSPDLDLRIDDSKDVITDRNNFEYLVTYQNLTNTTLRSLQIQVEIPPQLDFVSTTRGEYNKDSHSIFIGSTDLNASQGDSFRITVAAKKGLTRGDLIVASATASFMSPANGINDSSTDFDSDEYDPQTTGNGSKIIGSSSTGGFLPTSLIGWLSLIFLIFLFIAALRWLWFGKKGNEYSSAYGPYGVNPSDMGLGVVPPVIVNNQQPPQQPMYVPFNPNQR